MFSKKSARLFWLASLFLLLSCFTLHSQSLTDAQKAELTKILNDYRTESTTLKNELETLRIESNLQKNLLTEAQTLSSEQVNQLTDLTQSLTDLNDSLQKTADELNLWRTIGISASAVSLVLLVVVVVK
jgi:hypothetical protein